MDSLLRSADKAAADAFMVFQYAWMADPLYFGHYPELMVKTQGTLLPTCVGSCVAAGAAARAGWGCLPCHGAPHMGAVVPLAGLTMPPPAYP